MKVSILDKFTFDAINAPAAVTGGRKGKGKWGSRKNTTKRKTTKSFSKTKTRSKSKTHDYKVLHLL